MANLKFYKGGEQPRELGSIWFNNGLLSVVSKEGDGITGTEAALEYFSGVRDAEWVEQDVTEGDKKYKKKELKLVKADGTVVTLDFSDVASAQVLGALRTELDGLKATVESNKTAAEAGIQAAKDAAKAADDKAVAAQGAVDAYVESNDARVKAVEDDLKGYKETNDAAVEELGDKVTALETTVGGAESGLVKDVNDLKARFDGEGSVEDQITDAIDAVKQELTTKIDKKVDSETYATDKKALEDADAALEQAISTEKGRAEAAEEANANAIATEKARVDALVGAKDDEGNFVDAGKSVREIAAEELAAQLIPENAAESLDTLKELADWIQAHPEDASEMNSAIEANAAAIEVLNGEAEGSVKKAVADAKTEIYAEIEKNEEVTAEALNDLNTREGELRGRVETLEAVGAGDRLTAVENAVTTTLPAAIETAKGEAVAAAAADATSKANTAESNAKGYADGLIAAEVARSNKYADDAVAVEAAKVAANTAAITALDAKVTTGFQWAVFE